MQLVESCAFPPGEAVRGGGSTDVVDTGLDIEYFSGRLYVGLDHALQIGAAAGMVAPQAHAAEQEARERLQVELDGAELEVRALKSALEEAESLRNAIAYTLERGAVLDPKKLSVTLRQKPGTRRIDLSRSLWQAYVEAVE